MTLFALFVNFGLCLVFLYLREWLPSDPNWEPGVGKLIKNTEIGYKYFEKEDLGRKTDDHVEGKIEESIFAMLLWRKGWGN